jgi:Family of unknown function (DUF6174)
VPKQSAKMLLMGVTRGRWLVAGVLSACVLPGCSSSDLADYVEHADAWRSHGIDSYVWTLEVSEPVFGPKWTTVRVEHARPLRAMAGGERVPIVDGSANDVPATVDALFELLIRDADRAISVDVRWAETGYPSRIAVDYSDAIDDEVTFKVIRFEPLER